MFGGEGEPLLHKDLKKMLAAAFYMGIDCALTTNGVLLTPQIVEQMLRYNKWIKVSINAGTAKTYSGIHRTKEQDFDTVLTNLAYAVKIRKEIGSNCTLGMQAILLNENAHEMRMLAETARSIGVDYLVIKPYSHHQSSKHDDMVVSLPFIHDFATTLESYSTDKFRVIFRLNAFERMHKDRKYNECLALPFWAYISTEGDVWSCSAKMGNDDSFVLGNIYQDNFMAILRKSRQSHKLKDCRINCRMDACNEYLWKLKHPDPHVNFI
jgi:radical SAM protein with 4Fe4S-binding SPASM domain